MLTLQNTIQFASQKEKNIYFTFKEDMLKIMANQCKNKTWKLFSVTEIKLKEIQYKY